MNNRTIYITGPDGTGKTTFLKDLEHTFKTKHNCIKHIWLRSPKIISKPLMAYCRIIGLTKYEVIDGIKYGKHEFYRSRFVSLIFPILQLWDFRIKWFLYRRRIKNYDLLMLDRFSIDTLADLMVDTNRWNLHKTSIGRSFIKFIPDNCKIIYLKSDESTIKTRKLDTIHDEHLPAKIQAFNILSEDLDLIIIENNRAYDVVKEDIIKSLSN